MYDVNQKSNSQATAFRSVLALVEVEPPLPRQVYETTQDVRWLILALGSKEHHFFQSANGL